MVDEGRATLGRGTAVAAVVPGLELPVGSASSSVWV